MKKENANDKIEVTKKTEEGVIMAIVNLEMPEKMVTFAMPSGEEDQLERNAMILYPYIRKGIISHGKAAEILGIFKMDLITLYGNLGLPYIEMTNEELDKELETVRYLKEVLP